MVRPKEEERITDLPQAIKDAAWEQIARKGAAALSLRAIARAVGISAPAIYNHFHRRDDLVTALITDAFRSLGASQEAAAAGIAEKDLIARFRALGQAYRAWATTYPQRYQLIFGTPIPGYHAPEEQTGPAASASLLPLMRAVQALHDAGRMRTGALPAQQAPADDGQAQEKGQGFDPAVLYLTVVVWSRVHGLMAMELGNHLPPFMGDAGALYQGEIERMIKQYFII